MAKSDNPIDVYRRQQRKKALKKNKTTRIKARDLKVAATRSLDEVKSEISLLERKRDRNDAKTGLDPVETKRLERLRKELRIVTGESEKRKVLAEEARLREEKESVAAQKTVAGVQRLNESKYTLAERYASIYYDETMNPFGAPEPGKPKMYYADAEGKTTTMDSRRAVVPGKWRKRFEAEGGKDAVHPPPPAKKRRWDDRGEDDGRNNGGGGGNNNQQQQQQNLQMYMPPPPPNGGMMAPPQQQQQQQIPPPPPAFPPPPPPHNMNMVS